MFDNIVSNDYNGFILVSVIIGDGFNYTGAFSPENDDGIIMGFGFFDNDPKNNGSLLDTSRIIV